MYDLVIYKHFNSKYHLGTTELSNMMFTTVDQEGNPLGVIIGSELEKLLDSFGFEMRIKSGLDDLLQ